MMLYEQKARSGLLFLFPPPAALRLAEATVLERAADKFDKKRRTVGRRPQGDDGRMGQMGGDAATVDREIPDERK